MHAAHAAGLRDRGCRRALLVVFLLSSATERFGKVEASGPRWKLPFAGARAGDLGGVDKRPFNFTMSPYSAGCPALKRSFRSLDSRILPMTTKRLSLSGVMGKSGERAASRGARFTMPTPPLRHQASLSFLDSG